jgi:hypothetical protein
MRVLVLFLFSEEFRVSAVSNGLFQLVLLQLGSKSAFPSI